MNRMIITFAALSLAVSSASAQSYITSTTTRDGARSTPVVLTADIPLTADEHLALARKAQEAGDYATARRAYKVAALLDREDGRVPASAVFGLVSVLNAQGALTDAVDELDRLASDAARASNDEVEARALADAIWIKMQTGGRITARNDALRLRTLLQGKTLSPETRQYVTQRVN